MLPSFPIRLLTLFWKKKMRGLYFVNIEKASSYLLKWKTVCIDKGNGGLNVRCFSSMNMALLCLSKIKK